MITDKFIDNYIELYKKQCAYYSVKTRMIINHEDVVALNADHIQQKEKVSEMTQLIQAEWWGLSKEQAMKINRLWIKAQNSGFWNDEVYCTYEKYLFDTYNNGNDYRIYFD